MRPAGSLVLATAVRVLFHTVMLFSLYLLFSGHNAPGGGFAGGLVAGAAMVLLTVDGGPASLPRLLPSRPAVLVGGGIGVAGLTGAAALMAGDAFLRSGKLVLDPPLLGTVTLPSTLPFDTGVYLVVLGLVLTLLRTFGEEDVIDERDRRQEAQESQEGRKGQEAGPETVGGRAP